MNLADELILPAAPLSSPVKTQWQSVWILASIGLLYVSFGVSFGLFEYAIPPILLSQGVDVAKMGWVIALYIPFGLTFLWAPLIDAKPFPWFGYRIGWIVVSQAVSALLLVVIAYGATLPAAMLFALGLAVCFAVATMDLALDALAVDIVPVRHRANVAALKVSALALGGVLGGGVLLGLFETLQWKGIFLIASTIPVISTLPVLALSRTDRPRHVACQRASLWRILRRPGVAGRLLLLSLLATCIIGPVYFQRAILVEMQVPLADIGRSVGTLSPILNALTAALVVPFMNRFKPGAALWALVGICLVACTGLLSGIARSSPDIVIFWSLVEAAACSGIAVFIYALVLRWAEGGQAATDYAVLCGGSRLMATLALMAIPSWLPAIGWTRFYAAACVLLVLLAAWAYPHVQLIKKPL
jgi:MFS family permease